MDCLKRLIVEIHHRSLWQVLLIYIGAALMAYQAVQALTEGLGLPQWFPAFAVVLFIVGLPIVLATAFVRDVAPPTVTPAEPTPLTEAEAARIEVETAAAHLEARRRHRFLTWRNALASFVVAFAVWGVVATGWLVLHESGVTSPPAGRSVAVLPFVNMSADPENEYFSDGITDAIITHLTKIADLKVTSRTSSMLYKGADKSLLDIAAELGVTTIVEGSVQQTGDRIRVNAQLIDAQSDEHLWAEIYDRDLTDIFAIQSDVAQQVAAALEATLTPDERERIEQKPTENVEAYDFYLRGNEYFNRGWDPGDLGIAEQMYQRAVELDPEFALAHASLSQTHSQIYWYYQDRSDERLLRAREAVDSAFRLEPDLPEAHLALGYYYYHGRLDYQSALAQFEIARKSKPNDAEILEAIGYVQRRSGAWEEGLRALERSLELNPRSATTAHAVGVTHHWMGDYAEALRFLDRAISLAPDWIVPYFNKAQTWLAWKGDVEGARRALANASVALGSAQFFSQARSVASAETVFRILHDDYDHALRRLSLASFGGDSATYFLLKAEFYGLADEPQLARAYYDSARASLEGKTRERPAESLFHSQLGLAYAGLGRADEAIREGKEAVGLLPVSKEAWYGPDRVEDLAEIYVMVGEHEAAIEQLEYLLSVPSRWSIRFIQVDPVWDPLRDHPRFQALLERYD